MAAGFSEFKNCLKFIIPSFEGRLTIDQFQRAYLIPCLIWIVVLFAVSTIGIVDLFSSVSIKDESSFFTKKENIFTILKYAGIGLAVSIPFFIVWISLITRRFRDANLSPLWLLLLLIPGLGMTAVGIIALADTANSPDDPVQFSDLKNSFHQILHPGDRMSMKDWCVSNAVLSFIYTIASSAITLFSIPAAVIAARSGSSASSSSLASTLLVIAFFIFFIRLGIARLHDTGRSGLNFFWILLCGIGIMIPLIQCYADSDGENEYGLPMAPDDESRDDNNDNNEI